MKSFTQTVANTVTRRVTTVVAGRCRYWRGNPTGVDPFLRI